MAVKARLWPWLEPFSVESLHNHLSCPLFARKRLKDARVGQAVGDMGSEQDGFTVPWKTDNSTTVQVPDTPR